MITWARKEWIPDLKRIWKECFGDEDSYIDFYFEHRFKEDNMLVFVKEERPVAMVSLLPALLWNTQEGKEKQSLYYMYALATNPDLQGQGISSQLMHFIIEFLEQRNIVGILVPAEESLVSFYQKRGFYPAIVLPERKCLYCGTELKAAELAVPASSIPNFIFSEVSAKEYKEIRDFHFAGKGYVEWEEDAIHYAIEENRQIGGFTYQFVCGEVRHIAMVYCNERQLCIRETTLLAEEWKVYCSALADKLNCDNVYQRPLFSMSNVKKWNGQGYLGLHLN